MTGVRISRPRALDDVELQDATWRARVLPRHLHATFSVGLVEAGRERLELGATARGVVPGQVHGGGEATRASLAVYQRAWAAPAGSETRRCTGATSAARRTAVHAARRSQVIFAR